MTRFPDNFLSVILRMLIMALALAAHACADSRTEEINMGSVPLKTVEKSKNLADSLQYIIEHYDVFVTQKERRIDALKKILMTLDPTSPEMFPTNQLLIDEYIKFQADSAISYAQKNVNLARRLHDDDKLITSLTQLSMALSMAGRFREAESILDDIRSSSFTVKEQNGTETGMPNRFDPKGGNLDNLTAEQRCRYYEAFKFLWENYTISTNHDQIAPITYKDSLNSYLPKNSYSYQVDHAASFYDTDSLRTEQEFKRLLDSIPCNSAEYAMLTNYFASINRQWGNRERAKYFYQLSAITDLRNATRETLSLQALASMAMEEGNLQEAYRYINRTVDDIMLSGISFRSSEIYTFYSILSTALRQQEIKSHRSLILFICILAVGMIVLSILTILTYRQMKRIRSIKSILAKKNQTLHQLNEQLNEYNEKLNETNDKLSDQNNLLVESNLTKEHYITQFFDVCFSFVNKMEKEQNLLYKLTVSQSFDKLTQRLQSDIVVKEEIASLYERFDSVFLQLYPSFVESINSMLQSKERIVLKQNGSLTRELRIYALLRLGISDSAKIASFLRCSTGTIYNYRTRMRNRALNRESFEDDIMRIPASHDL